MREAAIVMPCQALGHHGTETWWLDFTREVAETFGGYTSFYADGGWWDGTYKKNWRGEDKKVIEREQVRVVTFAAPAGDIETDDVIRSLAIKWVGQKLDQDAVYVRFPTGDVEILEKGKDY